MGLDMTLSKVYYIGEQHRHNQVNRSIKITKQGKEIVIKEPITSIKCNIMYWRKANQIHKWFVDNIQYGEDDCKSYELTRASLIALRDLCDKALSTKDSKILPPTEGFFFGGTAIDDYYWEQIRETKDMLDKTLAEQDNDLLDIYYEYSSSW